MRSPSVGAKSQASTRHEAPKGTMGVAFQLARRLMGLRGREESTVATDIGGCASTPPHALVVGGGGRRGSQDPQGRSSATGGPCGGWRWGGRDKGTPITAGH
jgi:hypothetical protein